MKFFSSGSGTDDSGVIKISKKKGGVKIQKAEGHVKYEQKIDPNGRSVKQTLDVNAAVTFQIGDSKFPLTFKAHQEAGGKATFGSMVRRMMKKEQLFRDNVLKNHQNVKTFSDLKQVKVVVRNGDGRVVYSKPAGEIWSQAMDAGMTVDLVPR